ncbi:MAG TPA: hypothetical protein VIN08_16425 [Ohtaekwangia sp.]|uniref:hypothetical protein n=1 Tax=Ohtaekwangia sp. TaxID=2066019 RepID=UPI002F91F9F5
MFFIITFILITKNKTYILVAILLLSFISSCNNTGDEIQKAESIKIDNEGIETLLSLIDYNVTKLQENTSASKSSSSPDEIIMVNYIREFERIKGVNFHYSTASMASEEESTKPNTIARQVFQDKLNSCISSSTSEDEFLIKLSKLRKEVLNDQTDNIVKSKFLSKIALFEKFVNYIQEKVAFNITHTTAKEDDSKCKGWWPCWGKCAAGILGGAGTGALTFGLAGAAVGTVTLPVIGTVSAGAVGAIGGAITGGLTGAVSSCD